MKIYNAIEAKRLEAYVTEHDGIKPIEIVEQAAKTLYEEIQRLVEISQSVKVFAGPNYNGCISLALARYMSKGGYGVEVYLFNTAGQLSPECQTNRDRLVQGAPQAVFHEITQKFELPHLTEDDVVIDGLFGIGLSEPLTSSFALLVKFINNSPSRTISVDIPSGLMAEDNTQTLGSPIIRADYTLSLQGVKPAFLMADCQPYIGKCKILDLGIDSLPDDTPALYTLDEEYEMQLLLKPRDPFGNKGTFGHALLIAGSYGMAGAAVIAARAAMGSGIGKLTVHTPSLNNTILQTAVMEAIIHNDDDNFRFTTPEPTDAYDAVAIGPGLGTKQETAVAFMEQISHTVKPLIIDADGLTNHSKPRSWLQQIPNDTALTPHRKELARLFGQSTNDFDMINQAREQARHQQIYIVLKGHYTAICAPSGHVYFNTTGNSGMASAGTGDALTGILLSLLAQGYTPLDACRLGCYLHGLAGDLAADELSEEGMTVRDLVHYLPYAIKQLKNA